MAAEKAKTAEAESQAAAERKNAAEKQSALEAEVKVQWIIPPSPSLSFVFVCAKQALCIFALLSYIHTHSHMNAPSLPLPL